MKKLTILGLMCILLVGLVSALTLNVAPTVVTTPETNTVTIALSTDGNAVFSKDLAIGALSTSGPGTASTFTYAPGFDNSNTNRVSVITFTAVNSTNAADVSTQTVTITLTNVNRAPTANAGADIAREQNATITLNGAASADPDSDSLTYSWKQVGSGITLANANTATPSFSTSTLGTYTFELTVSDGQFSDTDEVVVTVSEIQRLELTDLDFDVGSDNKDGQQNAAEGSSLPRAMPGDRIKVKAKVKNTYTDAEDIEITDVIMTVTIEGIDEGDDIDDESKSQDIKAQRDDSFTVELSVPDRVDDDTYTVLIEIEGDDDNGITHTIIKRFSLSMDKDSDDVRIERADLGLNPLSCTRTTTLSIAAVNYGDKDQEEVKITAMNTDLKLNYELWDDGDLELGQGTDDDAELRTSVNIDASDLKPGTYPILVSVYIDEDERQDDKTVDLIVQNCVDTPAVTPPTQVPTTPTTQPTTPSAPNTQAPVYAQVQGDSFTESPAYVVLLSAAAVILVVLIIGIVAMLMRKRP